MKTDAEIMADAIGKEVGERFADLALAVADVFEDLVLALEADGRFNRRLLARMLKERLRDMPDTGRRVAITAVSRRLVVRRLPSRQSPRGKRRSIPG